MHTHKHTLVLSHSHLTYTHTSTYTHIHTHSYTSTYTLTYTFTHPLVFLLAKATRYQFCRHTLLPYFLLLVSLTVGSKQCLSFETICV